MARRRKGTVLKRQPLKTRFASTRGVGEIRSRIVLSRFMTKKQAQKVIDREVRKKLRSLEARGARVVRVKKIIVGSR